MTRAGMPASSSQVEKVWRKSWAPRRSTVSSKGCWAADVAAIDPHTQRWTLRPATQHPLLEAVDLHGAHDFRHTFSTWLEDAGIPARVIDELMGHQASGRVGRHQASAIGAHYRHTTPEMAARVVAAVEERLVVVLATAEAALDQQPW